MEWPRIAVLAVLASCATAGGDDDGIAAPTADATAVSKFPDAARFIDAAQASDAAPTIQYDATPVPADAGLFCQSSSTCGNGECCLLLTDPGLCVPGEEVIGVCLPL